MNTIKKTTFRKKTTFVAILAIVLATMLIGVFTATGSFSTTTVSAHVAEPSNLSVSQAHDIELLSMVRTPILNNSDSDMIQSSNFVSNLHETDFEIDRLDVILRREYSFGAADMDKFLEIPNISSVIGMQRPITDGDIANDRFRYMLTLTLEEIGHEQVLEAVAAVNNLNKVLLAQPSFIEEGGDNWNPPDDPFFAGQVINNINRQQWGLTGAHGIQAQEAWAFSRAIPANEANRIRIGLFETGIQANHPDLRVGVGNFAGGAAQDHGTHVGGIMSAITDNNRGMAGVSQTEIALLNRGTFRASLEWAAAQGIHIVNASFWQDRPTVVNGVVTREAQPNPVNLNAIAAFPGLFVATSGNQGLDNDVHPEFPGAYNLPNLINVGSIDATGRRSNFSNFGATSVHVHAPGGNILSTFPEARWGTAVAGYTQIQQGYAMASGTSMAAPHVSGLAALMLSVNPNMTGGIGVSLGARLRNSIEHNVDIPNVGGENPLHGLASTHGRVNAHRAVAAASFTTANATGGISVGLRAGLTLPANSNLTIPERIAPLGNANQQTITAISANAFSGQNTLSQITIPATVGTTKSASYFWAGI